MDDVKLEQQFQAELAALELFRVGYRGAHPHVPLRGDDPDVQRMIEALAFFTARTRLAAERSVDTSLHRIFRQHFPFFLTPLPALTMLTVTPKRALTEAVDIPSGTAVALTCAQAPGRKFTFRTLAPIKVLPIALASLTFERPGNAPLQRTGEAGRFEPRFPSATRDAQHRRIALHFVAACERSTHFDSIDLHADYLHDVGSSLLVYSELRRHALSASVTWDVVDARLHVERSRELPCGLEFRRPPELSADVGALEHPIQRIRAALHYPQQELRLRITDLSPPNNWRAFTVHIELGEGWPEALPLHREFFRLHTVPMVNEQRAMSQAFEHDGTRARHRLEHPARSPEALVPIAIHGVSRMTKAGLVPLVPSVLAPSADCYEAHTERSGSERRAYVSLHLPHAFEAPETIVADVAWHQPDVARFRSSDFDVRFATRSCDAVLSLEHELAPALETEVAQDRDTLLELLAIKGHRVLQLDEVRLLLRAIGAADSPLFRTSVEALHAVRTREKPSGRRRRSLKHVYDLEFSHITASELPKTELLCEQVFDLLRVWSGAEIVELNAHIPNLKQTLRLAAPEGNP